MALTSEFDPERLVIGAIRSGDRTAFGELVRRHDHWVRGVVFGVLGQQDRVDDAVQQVWTTAWERINELRDPARWRAWRYRLARNAALDAGRDIARRRKRMQELARHAVSANSGSPRCASDPASGGSQDPALGARIDGAESRTAIKSRGRPGLGTSTESFATLWISRRQSFSFAREIPAANKCERKF